MKVEIKSKKNGVLLKSLELGTVYELNGKYYLKCEYFGGDMQYSVSLDGSICKHHVSLDVFPINGTFVGEYFT